MLRLTRLRLHNFRNYERLNWEPGGSQVCVVTGPNGSGKTNLLEAVSLLAPGRGLRGARVADLPRRSSGSVFADWGVNARFATNDGLVEVGTGADPSATDRRAFRLDGAPPRNQAAIAARVAVLWLTPQMDALFQEPASGRRRFLDRLVYALEPAHARQIAAHDHAQSQRARLLASGRADSAWLAGLEDQVARGAVAATAARLSLTTRLNEALALGAAAGFPPAKIGLLCPIAERLTDGSALAAEDWLRASQLGSREADRAGGSAQFGAHRADMTIMDSATGRAADRASTGERKALLVGVVLGHAALVAGLRGDAPIMLLDEPMVHLDAERRDQLCAAALSIPAQFLLTGTDEGSFAGLGGNAGFFRARNGTLQP